MRRRSCGYVASARSSCRPTVATSTASCPNANIVRRLAERGEHALGEIVADVMSTRANTCAPDDSAEHLMRLMTEHRHRHLPVVSDDLLVGIVSIGDVVKSRLTELEEEARKMHDYISTGRWSRPPHSPRTRHPWNLGPRSISERPGSRNGPCSRSSPDLGPLELGTAPELGTVQGR